MAGEDYNAAVRREQGGDREVVGSGGSLDVESGGEIDLEAGSAFKVGGTDIRADLAAAAGLATEFAALSGLTTIMAAIAAGKKIAHGIETPTAGQVTVVTGLTTVEAVVASLEANPTLTHMFAAAEIGDQAGSPAAGSIYINSAKPTAVGDVTPIAATTPWGDVGWIAIGT